ncbi:MAG: hypothetical protein FJW86_13230 [Actinobacteria bacterium]|nr:hypothetical protein [Actinomycetota bacterium]
MKSHKVLVGVTVLNVLLVAAAWFGLVGVGVGSAQSPSSGALEASGFDMVNDNGVVVGQLARPGVQDLDAQLVGAEPGGLGRGEAPSSSDHGGGR